MEAFRLKVCKYMCTIFKINISFCDLNSCALDIDECNGLTKEHRAKFVGFEEQNVAIAAELEESRSQLQQITTVMTKKENTLAELTDKLSHSEQQLLNAYKKHSHR